MNWRFHEVRKTCPFSNEPYLALAASYQPGLKALSLNLFLFLGFVILF